MTPARRRLAFHGGFLVAHLLAADPRWHQAFGTPAHHQDEGDAVEQEAVLGELPEQLGQADDDDGTEHDPGNAAHAADDDDGDHQDGDVDVDGGGLDRAVERGEDGPAQAGEGGTQHVRQRLGLDQVDAQRLGHVLVLADGDPGATEARVTQAHGDEGDDGDRDERDVVDLVGPGQPAVRRDLHADGGQWLGDVGDAGRTADVLLQQVGPGQDGDDLAEAQRGDSEVVTADAEDGQAQQQPEAHGRQDGEGDGEEERPTQAEITRPGEQRDGVGADGEEGHEAEVQQARQPQRDVESEAHQCVQRHQRDDRRDEAGEAQRQQQHEQQRDASSRDHHRGMPLRLLRQSPPALYRLEHDPRQVDQQDRAQDDQGTRHAQAIGGEELARQPRGQVLLQHGGAHDAGEEAHEDEQATADDGSGCAPPSATATAGRPGCPGSCPRRPGTRTCRGRSAAPHVAGVLDAQQIRARDQVIQVRGGIGQVVAQLDGGADDQQQ